MNAAIRSMLRALADRAGILREYVDFRGERRPATDAAREALLAAMGFDASSEESAENAIHRLDDEKSRRILDPARVVTQSQSPPAISLRIPENLGENAQYSMDIRLEDGQVIRRTGRVESLDSRGEFTVTLSDPLPLGYHDLTVTLGGRGAEQSARQRLIAAPLSCCSPQRKFGDRRLFGLWTQLYSLRGANDQGVGDFAALRELVDWAGEAGASFVGLNPLHALRNRDHDVSPYRPVSRLFRNPIYLDLGAIPEISTSSQARSNLGAFPRSVSEDGSVRYDEVTAHRRPILQLLHREFLRLHGSGSTDRGKSYRAYLDREGEALWDFTTFLALDENFRKEHPRTTWREWPAEYRDSKSPAVAEFRARQKEEISFHAFVQFEIDRQLESIAARGRELGMPIGLYQDLALSTSPDGFEPWAFPDLFIRGASLGAPPDDLGPLGQNWSLPPLHPLRLRETGFEYWRNLLRRSFASAGALRIDHVMGLLRQFWIPEGKNGADGAYVSFPADELFAILALESRRANAVVIGEDLGTVPWGFGSLLEKWGVLSTRVLYFERDEKGEFRAPSSYPARSLATVSTHDLVPMAGFWRDRDLALRRKVGQIRDEAELASAKHRRDFDRQALLRRFQAENLCSPSGIGNAHEVVTAAHALLARSPAVLVGASVDDLALEIEPVNLPGIGQEGHPNWSRRMSSNIAKLRSSPQTARMLAPLEQRRFDAPLNVLKPT